MVDRVSLLRRHDLPLFLVVALFGSWLCWSLVPRFDGPAGALLLVGGGVAPVAAAAALAAARGTLSGWVAAVTHWRAPWRWYLLAVGVPITGVTAAGWLVQRFTPTGGGAVPSGDGAVVAVAVFVVAGVAEAGWRGFALPRLQERLPPFAAAVALAIVWVLWLLPLSFAWPPFPALSLPLGVFALGLAILLTWLYNVARASVVAGALLAGLLVQFRFWLPATEVAFGLYAGVLFAISLLAVVNQGVALGR